MCPGALSKVNTQELYWRLKKVLDFICRLIYETYINSHLAHRACTQVAGEDGEEGQVAATAWMFEDSSWGCFHKVVTTRTRERNERVELHRNDIFYLDAWSVLLEQLSPIRIQSSEWSYTACAAFYACSCFFSVDWTVAAAFDLLFGVLFDTWRLWIWFLTFSINTGKYMFIFYRVAFSRQSYA